MKFKHLVFFDFDDTLSDFLTGVIPVSALKALNSLKERGDIVLGVASGRGAFYFKENHTDLGFDAIVSVNGQCALYHDLIVREETVDDETVKRITDMMKQFGGGLFQINSTLGTKQLVEATDPRVTDSDSYLAMFSYGRPFTQNAVAHQLIGSFHPDYESTLKDAFPHLSIHRYNGNNVDIFPKTSSKLKAIEAVAKHVGLTLKDVIAFGDGLNDVEMIQGVGLGIAMGNAKDEVKAVSAMITDSVKDDGVYNACIRINLIKEKK